MKLQMKKAVCMLLALMMLMSAACTAEETDLQITEGLDPAWHNILLLGTDNRSSEEPGRTDTMIILSVNAETNEVRMTSLMRDTWVEMGSRSAKLNAAHVYGGPDLTMRTINRNFGMNIEDYVLVDMQALKDIIDSLGGVDLPLTDGEARNINEQMEKDGREGERLSSGDSVHLNGDQALCYVRIRYIDNDYRRTERQRAVLMAMAGKLKDTSLFALTGVITGLLGQVETNLSLGELISLGRTALQVELSGVQQNRLPADGTFESGIMDNGQWSIRPDFEANTKRLYEFIYGNRTEEQE